MDAVSIAIIVTVLSMGSFLVYLFKSEFEQTKRQYSPGHTRSKQKNSTVNGNKYMKTIQAQSKQRTTLIVAGTVAKQVALETLSSAASTQRQSSGLNNTQSSGLNGKQAPASRSNGHIPSEFTKGDYNPNQKVKQVASKKKIDSLNGDVPEVHPVESMSSYEELSADELDSSVLLGVFNPTNNNNNQNQNKPQVKLQSEKQFNHNQQQQHGGEKKPARKRHTFGDVKQSCSAEHLISMIAKCELSSDEVELAVECLLNKIETGESDWKQPKSNPLQRLKNQLRDNESALLVEVQNHEQTRMRLMEIKSQLQNERSSSNLIKEELVKLRKEFGVVNLSLEQARCDSSKHQILYKQLKEESSHVISKLEQEKVQLQTVLANTTGKETEFSNLRNELDEKMSQLQRYELSNQTMREKIEELELQVNNARLLEKSVKELQSINGRQEDLLQRLRDERHVNAASMKHTLCEMEQELKELQTKLSANSASHDERHRKEMSQVERELSNADQREQKLMSEIRELREGLAALLPNDIKASESHNLQGDANWVQQYLAAFKQLAKTVDELKACSNNRGILESPSKKSVDKSTLTVSTHTNGASSRVGSPMSNGKSSRVGSHMDYDGDKKLMETKLLELNDYAVKLESEVRKLEEEKRGSSTTLPSASDQSHYQQQTKDLKMQCIRLEAQIKFGLDSLRMEQERVRALEEELSKYKANVSF